MEGKGKKDRYVPLADILIRGLKSYLEAEHPDEWIFNSKDQEVVGRVGGDTSTPLSTCYESRYSQHGVHWAFNEAKKKADIVKPMSVHTLRHCFATHLLVEGLDILTIKNLQGHGCIDTTMIYLYSLSLIAGLTRKTSDVTSVRWIDFTSPDSNTIARSGTCAQTALERSKTTSPYQQLASPNTVCPETLPHGRPRRAYATAHRCLCMHRMRNDAYQL